MAIPINPGDIVEVRLIGQLHGQVVENIFHYEADTAAADWTLQAAAALGNFETAVWGGIRLGISNEVQSVYFEGQIIWPVRYRKATFIPAARAGNIASSSLPSGVSIVVRRQGDAAARWSQGRIYVPGLPTSFEDDSRLSAAWVAAHQANYIAAAGASLAAGGAATWQPRIFNLKNPARKTPIQWTILDNIIRYQRRREVGVGI